MRSLNELFVAGNYFIRRADDPLRLYGRAGNTDIIDPDKDYDMCHTGLAQDIAVEAGNCSDS
jgi:hypothetical protein